MCRPPSGACGADGKINYLSSEIYDSEVDQLPLSQIPLSNSECYQEDNSKECESTKDSDKHEYCHEDKFNSEDNKPKLAGWLYCLSNVAFILSLFKIGETSGTPEKRAKELYTTGVPSPYKVEFAKYVPDRKKAERYIHKILSKLDKRYNPKREFFQVPLEVIKDLFEMIPGKWWSPSQTLPQIENELKTKSNKSQCRDAHKGCRDARKCLNDGQKIRHGITINGPYWIGVYNLETNSIIMNGKIYKSPRKNTAPLNNFAISHYNSVNKNRCCDAWGECQCEIDGKWISMFDLPILR